MLCSQLLLGWWDVCDGDCAFSLILGGDGACGDVAPVDAGHVALLVMVAAAERAVVGW
jgi:hypothetical protein